MSSSSSTRLLKPEPARRHVPLAERGRMLFVTDIQKMFGKDDNGRWRKSEWWVRNTFAPEKKQKLGRDPYWWETDAVAWLDREDEE